MNIPHKPGEEKSDIELYHKMVDNIAFLGPNCIMKMNLLLFSNSEKLGRKYYYNEVQTSFNNITTRKIIRKFDGYLSIENLKPTKSGKKAFIIIRQSDLENLRLTISPSIEYWMTHKLKIFELRSDGKFYKIQPDHKFKDLEEKNEWLLKHGPLNINIGSRNSLIFEPSMFCKWGSDDLDMGINMYLDSDIENVIQMQADRVMTLNRIIRDFDINLYSATMMSYLGRPQMGTNLYRCDLVHDDSANPFNSVPEDSNANNKSSSLGFFARLAKEKEKRRNKNV